MSACSLGTGKSSVSIDSDSSCPPERRSRRRGGKSCGGILPWRRAARIPSLPSVRITWGGTAPSRRGRNFVSFPRLAEVVMYRIIDRPISADELGELVADPAAGGICVFLGVVRDTTRGRRVRYLEYEAHVPMAESKMKE